MEESFLLDYQLGLDSQSMYFVLSTLSDLMLS